MSSTVSNRLSCRPIACIRCVQSFTIINSIDVIGSSGSM